MKQINIRVDDDTFAGIEARAEAAGLTVPEYARQVVADESNDLRHRFLTAGAHFTDAWAPAFAEAFGPYPAKARQDEAAA
ncbi:plasmid mobilization protein [Peterkaempfera griseoplana]|uniref:plasmid mobilization protein n=1 Tax=Peterkaempfera griseoplana TaxID=66896 RepID=UPI0006E2B53D|nr:hypothetical protein [Peterkaempfera griseoplana]